MSSGKRRAVELLRTARHRSFPTPRVAAYEEDKASLRTVMYYCTAQCQTRRVCEEWGSLDDICEDDLQGTG